MKRKAQALMLLAALGGGCMTTNKTETMPVGSLENGRKFGEAYKAKEVPNVQGSWGDPVAVRAGETPPKIAATSTAQTTSKGGVVQASAKSDKANVDSGVKQAVVKDAKAGQSNIQQAHYDKMTVQCGPGPVPGAVAATGAMTGGTMVPAPFIGRTEVRFAGPSGMQVAWFAPSIGGPTGFTSAQVQAPGRYNFPQGAIYRLKLSNIPGRAGVELYPTLEVAPASSKTAVFLAHSAVPVGFTEEDFEQVAAGNFVVKVIYLPDPQFQDLAAAAPDEVVSTRLEPGVDPIAEAMRRGSILLIIRMGNIDLEAPNTPPMNAQPNRPMMGPPGMPGRPIMPPGSSMPMPGGPTPMPPGGASMLEGPAGRSSVVVPDYSKPAGKVTGSVDGTALRMK